MALALVRRTETIGATVDLLVLGAGRFGCIGVDVRSGALVRAVHHGPPAADLHPFDVARAAMAEPDDHLLDPAHPEALPVAGPPVAVGRLDRRRAERLLRPLLHPTDRHLLGTVGSDVPYWELDGLRPSVSLVEPRLAPVVRDGWCTVVWRGLPQALPLAPGAPVSISPGRIVVAFAAPHDGRCAKQVVAVLPR